MYIRIRYVYVYLYLCLLNRGSTRIVGFGHQINNSVKPYVFILVPRLL